MMKIGKIVKLKTIFTVDKILEYRLLQEIPKNLCINFIEFPYFILKNPKDYIKNIKYLI